jgi:hypothetical protein
LLFSPGSLWKLTCSFGQLLVFGASGFAIVCSCFFPAKAQPSPDQGSQAACLQAYASAPWKKTLYIQPALALGMGDNWRMVVRGNQLAEIYITDYDGKCWDIIHNPLTSGPVKINTYWQGYPDKRDGGERYRYHVVIDKGQLVLVQTDKESCRLAQTAAQDPVLVHCVPVGDTRYVLGVRRN